MITPLDPARYVRTPWRNGGGVTVDMAGNDVWRFSRTPITAAGAFSDYSGFDRMQVLVSGSGLVLLTPEGEIDVRRLFRPVRFAGETPITSLLESGPVEVVNLLGERGRVGIDLRVLDAGDTQHLDRRGRHVAYCPSGQAGLRVAGKTYRLEADGGLSIEDTDGAAACTDGVIVLASVTCASR